ncbi:Hypothetical protein CINCED_3A003239 [Cinara cedri]|uniref:Uncharacterized protein n=1 Tax=Cinara cedri TaxID=506608 RepID=A0A5E4M8L1_9HEMI|nr:Hypothetical protein CINCED_3A003239 [Cinara cedri]
MTVIIYIIDSRSPVVVSYRVFCVVFIAFFSFSTWSLMTDEHCNGGTIIRITLSSRLSLIGHNLTWSHVPLSRDLCDYEDRDRRNRGRKTTPGAFFSKTTAKTVTSCSLEFPPLHAPACSVSVDGRNKFYTKLKSANNNTKVDDVMTYGDHIWN